MIKLSHILNEDKSPCWKGYKQVGMKKKGDRMVPNCVPISEASREQLGVDEKYYLEVAVSDATEALDLFNNMETAQDEIAIYGSNVYASDDETVIVDLHDYFIDQNIEFTDHNVDTVDEDKKAKKDYDGDGEIESPEDEYLGSRDKAINEEVNKPLYRVLSAIMSQEGPSTDQKMKSIKDTIADFQQKAAETGTSQAKLKKFNDMLKSVPIPQSQRGSVFLDSAVVESEDEDPAEIKVGSYQTRYFDMCPAATALYKELPEQDDIDMDLVERLAKVQDVLFYLEKKTIQNIGTVTDEDIKIAENLQEQIMRMADMLGLSEEHNYIQTHIDNMKAFQTQNEDIDIGHQDDEPEMLKATAHEAAEYAEQLKQKLDAYDDLDTEIDFPNWWQSKIILAKDYLQKAYHYLNTGETLDELNESTLNESTRSQVGIKRKDGTLITTYVHYDGYPRYMKQVLKTYGDRRKLLQLLKLGKDGISVLDKSIKGGDDHSFKDPKRGETIFYGRDRGEENPGMLIKSKDINKHLVDAAAASAEYVYIWDEEAGEWMYIDMRDKQKVIQPLYEQDNNMNLSSLIDEEKFIAVHKEKEHDIEASSAYDARQKAIGQLKLDDEESKELKIKNPAVHTDDKKEDKTTNEQFDAAESWLKSWETFIFNDVKK